MTRIAVALFEDAEELDFAGPWEVLAAWANQWPDDGVEVFTVAATTEPVRCAKGMRVLPDHTWASAPAIDVLVYPGGRGSRRELADEQVLERLRGLRGDGTLMTSVCTGALVFAAAGLLRDRPATTTGSSTAARSSRRPASPPASTWPSTSLPASTRSSAPARCAATSSTTPSLRSEDGRTATAEAASARPSHRAQLLTPTDSRYVPGTATGPGCGSRFHSSTSSVSAVARSEPAASTALSVGP